MDGYFMKVDRFAETLARFVIGHRWTVVGGALLVTALLAAGMPRLEFANNYRVFFSDENPELIAFENLQATYTKNDNFLFVLEPADGEVFTPTTLQAVEALTEAAWSIPFAIRVDSLSNFQHTHAEGDELIVEDLISDAQHLTTEQLAERSRIALAEPLLNGQLVTPDSRATAVNVVLQYPEQSLTEVPEAVAVARDLQARIATDFTHLEVSLTGVSMLNNAFAEAGVGDLGSLVPLMFVAILVMTLVIVRSVGGTLATLAVIVLSTLAAMGVAGYAGVKLTPISASAPIVILTLAIADSIHVLVSMRAAMREGAAKDAALVEALRQNLLPVTITSVTTVIGFLALNFSDAPPFWHLGNITAAGIVAAWVFSLTLLPALVSLLPYRVAPRGQVVVDGPMHRLADFVIANPRRLVLGTGVATLLLVAAIPSLQLDDQWVEYFDERVSFRTETDRALQHFGLYPIEYSVEAQGPGGVSDPGYLENVEAFAEFLRAQPGVTHVYALTDIMKRLNRNLHGDDPAHHRLPEDHDLSAQYLLLYEMSLPYGLDLNDRVNIDKSATRVTATLAPMTSDETKALLDRTARWLDENTPEWLQAKPTSAAVMFTYIAERNVMSMVTGSVVAIVAISMIMVLALRSLGLGLLSLLPNALPILATFGAWALLVGSVGFSVATVASISLGIIVDDSVHLLTKFVRARRERGLTTADAIRHAFDSVGTAIVINTVILSVGFLVLTTSTFKINVDMGLLTVLAIVFALLLDFLFLPALLLLLERRRTASNPGDETMKSSNPLPKRLAEGTAALLLAVGLIATVPTVEAAMETAPRGSTEAQLKGFEVAALSDRSDRGFGDSEVELTMVLRNATGKETQRRLTIATLEVPDESVGDQSLVMFSTPRDIAGTALLSHARILDPDDQWLYLPALKRVKRISSANKSGPFVGSEFAFEDFTSLELNKYDYEWLREETCGAFTCDVVVRHPRYENSGYTRQVSWIDREVHQIRKVEFYDRRGDLLKTLELGDYREYPGGVWRAHRLAMVNHQTRKATDLVYGDYRFGLGLDGKDFVKGRLKRLR
ncbi:MAG: outer membrane lipoprotein-sorting protein [Gammaproteobacteria bacterium]|jgi:predicted RND superfamily exporter protein|nr:outer membrane lipoprotein-sorting protein [Gammaproteobacteria bacterium]